MVTLEDTMAHKGVQSVTQLKVRWADNILWFPCCVCLEKYIWFWHNDRTTICPSTEAKPIQSSLHYSKIHFDTIEIYKISGTPIPKFISGVEEHIRKCNCWKKYHCHIIISKNPLCCYILWTFPEIGVYTQRYEKYWNTAIGEKNSAYSLHIFIKH
jgi:hypothetical protein